MKQLTRDQLKKIVGGNGSESSVASNKCNFYCKLDSECDPPGGQCPSCEDAVGTGGRKLCVRP